MNFSYVAYNKSQKSLMLCLLYSYDLWTAVCCEAFHFRRKMEMKIYYFFKTKEKALFFFKQWNTEGIVGLFSKKKMWLWGQTKKCETEERLVFQETAPYWKKKHISTLTCCISHIKKTMYPIIRNRVTIEVNTDLSVKQFQ